MPTDRAYQNIVKRLHVLRTQWRILLLSHSLLRWLAVLMLALAVALVINQALPLPRVLRMGLVVLWLGVGLFAAYRYLIQPVFRKLTIDHVAAYVEKSHPGFENRILSAIQLKPEIETNRLGYAVSFIHKLVDQARQSVGQIEPKRVFADEFVKLKRYGGFAVGALALLLVLNWIFPTGLGELAVAFEALPKTPQEMLVVQIEDVQPGNARVQPGANVTISAKVTGNLGAPVQLYYRVGQGESAGAWRELSMTRNDTALAYHFTLQNVTQGLEYYIASKSVSSERYHITVAQEPVVSQFRLKLNFPKYTQLPPQVLEEGDITAVVGTAVQFEGESNVPVVSGALVFETSERTPLRITEDRQLFGEFIARQSERYHIELIDADGVSNSAPISYIIQALPDQPPQVSIVVPGRDIVLDKSMLVTLHVEAKDDYGVQELRLVYRVEGQEETDTSLPLKRWDTPEPTAFADYVWDIDTLGVFPGDTVTYYAEAVDANNVTGPGVGRSPTYSIRVPSLAELHAAIESQQEGEQGGLEALYDEQAEATAMVDELLDKIRKSQELTLQDEKVMEQVLENQKQIEEAAQELVQNMKQTAEQMVKQQLFDMETVEKYQELQQLMEQALSEEHKELLRKLSEALEQQQLSEQERALMEANFDQEQFLQQLDRLKELYQQMILQQKLEAAANQAKDLAERQERLMAEAQSLLEQANQQSQQTSAESLANREDRVGEGMEELHQKLDELGQKMSELANLKRVGDEIQRLNGFAREQQITQNLQASSANMRSGQMQGAMQPGQQAQQALGELAQGLDNALEFMEGANADETMAAIREAVRSGLYLSREHERVIENTDEILQIGHGQYTLDEIKRLQQLAADELGLGQGLGLLASRLWELGKQQMQIDPKIVWRLQAAGDAFERGARALEDRKPSLAAPIQKQGLADVNQAVADLLKAMDQMNMQMSGSAMENMLEQLQQLAQNQGQLNEMAQQLSQQMRQQGRTPGNEQMLKRLAYEQQLIREATERLSDMMEQLSQALGDLKSIAEEMKEVEGELQQGNLNKQVMDKQREILTRMLESSKSLQKREVSKKRKSEVAKTPSAPGNEAPPLDPRLLESVQKMEANLRSGQAENLPPQYRHLIEQYFRALSQQTQRP